MEKLKNRKWIVFFAVFLLLAAARTAHAAELGSLEIINIEHPVRMHRVASSDAVLTEPFAAVPGVSLSDLESAVKNAKTLFKYAEENNIPGWDLSPEENAVLFAPLEEGVYLVYSLAQEAEFTPFLVSIPTQINGEAIHHIQAKPKEEPPTKPTDPPDATEPVEPEIPQTGNSVIPKYVLLVLGTAITLFGVADLIRGRERKA